MAKFNPSANVRQKPQRTVTHEGAAAYQAPTMQELAFTAATTYAGEDTFYETADRRMERLLDLVHQAVWKNPGEVAKFVSELRDRYQIRSASIVVAAQYAREMQQLGYPPSAPAVRDVVSAACQRADEPAEFIAYWQGRYGIEHPGRTKATLPKGVKKGLADAGARLFTPNAALKWNSHERQIRMGDVIELVHPDPQTEAQSALFRLILDERHRGAWETGHDANMVALAQVPMISERIALGKTQEVARREILRRQVERLWKAGFTWEHLSSWLPGGMDAEAWEAIIPRMGVMALIRNLRNFDDAGISSATIDAVIAKITSENDVIESRILPYRAYTAYTNSPSDNWKRALNTTLDLASRSAPRFDDTLLVIDTSGSMRKTVSKKSVVSCITLAALQAMTVARGSANTDVVIFGDRSMNIDRIDANWRRLSTLAQVGLIEGAIGVVGSSTFGHTAIGQHFNPARHKRAVMFTDDQMWDDESRSAHVPQIVTFNLAGYAAHSTWGKNRLHVGGFSDQVFKVVSELVRD